MKGAQLFTEGGVAAQGVKKRGEGDASTGCCHIHWARPCPLKAHASSGRRWARPPPSKAAARAAASTWMRPRSMDTAAASGRGRHPGHP